MAGPILHMVLALQAFNAGFFPDLDKQQFLVGTSFPDIRYLGVIERSQTHDATVTLKRVREEKNSFKAGMLFHALVDRVRETWYKEQEIYEHLPQSPMIGYALKMREDMLVYTDVDNWPKVASYFDTIYDEERAFGIAEEQLENWHTLLKQACAGPNPALFIGLLQKYGKDPLPFMVLLKQLSNDDNFKDFFMDFKKQALSLLLQLK